MYVYLNSLEIDLLDSLIIFSMQNKYSASWLDLIYQLLNAGDCCLCSNNGYNTDVELSLDSTY